MITVLTDGQCRFCEATMAWVSKKLDVSAIAYQSAELSQYGLSYEQCSEAVHVLHAGKTYVGADAIAYLLSRRGNWILPSGRKNWSICSVMGSSIKPA